MRFITTEDLRIEMMDYVRDMELEDDESYLRRIEAAAIQKVIMLTGRVTNIDFELKYKGDARNADLIRTIVIIMQYDMESRLEGDVTDNTKDRYKEVLAIMSDIRKKLYEPTWLMKDPSIDNTVTTNLYYSDVSQNTILY